MRGTARAIRRAEIYHALHEIDHHPDSAVLHKMQVSDLEWRTLMVGAVVMESSADDDGGGGNSGASRPKAPSLDWMSGKAWDQLLAYESTLGAPFEGLPDAVVAESSIWKV